MKTLLRQIVFGLTLSITAIACAGMPKMDVTVSNEKGTVVYRGKTGADGYFASRNVEPGNYVVQFHSQAAGSGQYALVVAAGKTKVMAEAVAGAKFGKGGVAVRVTAGKGVNITGQVTSGKLGAVKSSASGNIKVKIINGKRYVWVGPETGSNIGGRWVEEGSPAANVHRINAEGVQNLQDRGSQVHPGGN